MLRISETIRNHVLEAIELSMTNGSIKVPVSKVIRDQIIQKSGILWPDAGCLTVDLNFATRTVRLELVVDTPATVKACVCSLDVLFQTGCKCGGK